MAWLKSRDLSSMYIHRLLRYLNRFPCRIKGPMDVVRLFSDLTLGQKHNLQKALRTLLRFYEVQGLASDYWLDLLRKNIPKTRVGIDLRIPSESEIVGSLAALAEMCGFEVYFAVYNLALDSGLRVVESVRLFNSVVAGEVQVEENDGFYVAPLGYFRRTKTAYYGFFTQDTMDLLKRCGRKTCYVAAKSFKRKRGKNIVSYKYLRKFAFDKMIELEVPESVADFIEGRTPKTIGAKHYMVLVRQAKKYYPRYADYITKLRRKALN